MGDLGGMEDFGGENSESGQGMNAEKPQLTTSILRRRGTWIAAGAAVLSGVILAILDGTGLFWPGIFAYSLLLLLSVAGFAWASHLFQPNRAVQRAAWIAFGLRLGLGVALMLFLPLAGYQDSQASQAGYVFTASREPLSPPPKRFRPRMRTPPCGPQSLS